MEGGKMASKKRWIGSFVAIFTLSLFLMNGCGEKRSEEKNGEDITNKVPRKAARTGDLDIGLPIYPGAKQDPAQPSVNAPHMKNIHIFTSDPLEKVVEWYSRKLGEFDIERQTGGTQAMWSKKTPDGIFMTVTISNIFAPPGQVEITMTKMGRGK